MRKYGTNRIFVTVFTICLIAGAITVYVHLKSEPLSEELLLFESSRTMTMRDGLTKFIIQPGLPVQIKESWFVELHEIDSKNNKCRMSIVNQPGEFRSTFWIGQSESIKGIDEFCVNGIQVALVEPDSVTLELKWSEISLD